MRTQIVFRRFCFGAGLLICFYTLFNIYDTFNSRNCSNEDSKKAISDLCNLHLMGKAAGNLCPDLCSNGKVQYQTCTNYRGGKQVFVTKWDQTTVVFKSKRASFYDFDSVAYPGENGPRPPSIEAMTSIIQDSIEFNFKLKINRSEVEDLPNTMWTRDLKKFIKRNQGDHQRLLAAYQSLYSLIQQDEYLFMKYFHSLGHVPQIYGSCGHFYVMEYLPPGKLLSTNLLKKVAYFASWSERVAIARGLLKLVSTFQSMFPHPLHMCDIKGENFGRGDDGMVKLIDTDSVFFEPKLKEVLVNDSCKVHDDCNFFDCMGFCDLRARRCTDRRVNSNLQAVCKKVFVSGLENAYSGLLQSPPPHVKNREQLGSLLKYCANNLVYRSRMRNSLDMNEDQVYNKLVNLLQE